MYFDTAQLYMTHHATYSGDSLKFNRLIDRKSAKLSERKKKLRVEQRRNEKKEKKISEKKNGT